MGAQDAPADRTPAETVMASASASAPAASGRPLPANSPIRGAPRTAAPSSPTPVSNPSVAEQTPPALVPVPPPAPVPRKRGAGFIAAEPADSTLKLAADGKLPELRLEERAAKQKPEQGERSVNPLAMLGVLTISVVLSIVLALMDMGSPPVSGGRKKAEMRQKLEDHYFGLGDLKVKQLEPYQILLREARQAYSRGDYKTEREHYRKALDMLRAERGSEERGLTGSRSKDRELEEALLALLSGG